MAKGVRRVLVTGSRSWADKDVLWDALDQQREQYGLIVVVHGGCPTGADWLAWKWCHARGVACEVHTADWTTHGKAAGPLRNQRMVDLGADVCLAFPFGESKGTRHCMKAAKKAGIPIKDYSYLLGIPIPNLDDDGNPL
jgi:hypothetical protein